MEHKNKTWIYISCNFVISSITSFTIFYIFHIFLIDTNFINSQNCLSDAKYQVCFYGENGIWNDSSYLQTISSFYTSIITVLIGILALVGVVATLSLRASVRVYADQEIPQIIKGHFKTIEARNTLIEISENYIRNSVVNNLHDIPIALPQNGELAEAFKALEQRLEAAEQELMEMREQ